MVSGVGSSAASAMGRAAVVTTPEQLQQAISAGTAHIIVESHLNMLSTPRFDAGSRLNGSAVVMSGTTSIRVSFYQNGLRGDGLHSRRTGDSSR